MGKLCSKLKKNRRAVSPPLQKELHALCTIKRRHLRKCSGKKKLKKHFLCLLQKRHWKTYLNWQAKSLLYAAFTAASSSSHDSKKDFLSRVSCVAPVPEASFAKGTMEAADEATFHDAVENSSNSKAAAHDSSWEVAAAAAISSSARTRWISEEEVEISLCLLIARQRNVFAVCKNDALQNNRRTAGSSGEKKGRAGAMKADNATKAASLKTPLFSL